MKILSLDISSKSTGWSLIENGRLRNCGVIKTNPKTDWAVRLAEFRGRLATLLLDKFPDHVVIEDTFASKNPKVVKMLAHMGGVAMECCITVLKLSPFIMSNTTPKSYFKVKNKEQLYNVIVDFFELPGNWTFKKNNDMTDSIAQGICYYDIEFDKNIKQETSYGYLFKIKERRKLKENGKKRN